MSKIGLITGVLVALAVAIGAGVYMTRHQAPQTPTDTAGTFSDASLDLSFSYKNTYTLERRTDGFEGKTITVLVLTPKGVKVPDMSEGPTTISVIVVPNPEKLPLDQWIKTKSISNWYLSNPQAEMGASTVGGESGLGYTFDGLYQNTAIAVAHDGNIYLFTVGTITADDQIKKDYFDLIDSVTFK